VVWILLWGEVDAKEAKLAKMRHTTKITFFIFLNFKMNKKCRPAYIKYTPPPRTLQNFYTVFLEFSFYTHKYGSFVIYSMGIYT
jgi:hypothetical protein